MATYPVSLVTGRDAVEAVIRARVHVVEEWAEAFRSPSIEIRIPKTVALNEYVNIHAAPKFCRRSVLLRDRFRCQYCGEKFAAQDLTFDHVIPRAKGGETVWDNILMACGGCNARKRDQSANWSGKKGGGMRPLKEPRQPTTMELLRAGAEFIEPEVNETWGSWIYWSSELKP